MAIKEDETRQPLMASEEGSADHETSREHPWMVYLSTFVAVCGSYEFGTCVSSYYYIFHYCIN